MLTKNDFCDYETCVALKELGYKGISRFFYASKESPLRRYSYDQILTTRIADAVGHTLAISLYVAQKWLREEKNIDVLIEIECKDVHLSSKHYSVFISYMGRFMRRFQYLSNEFDSYEEALSEGVKCAIKILKENETIHE